MYFLLGLLQNEGNSQIYNEHCLIPAFGLVFTSIPIHLTLPQWPVCQAPKDEEPKAETDPAAPVEPPVESAAADPTVTDPAAPAETAAAAEGTAVDPAAEGAEMPAASVTVPVEKIVVGTPADLFLFWGWFQVSSKWLIRRSCSTSHLRCLCLRRSRPFRARRLYISRLLKAGCFIPTTRCCYTWKIVLELLEPGSG